MSKKVLLIDQFKKLLQMTFSSSVRWGVEASVWRKKIIAFFSNSSSIVSIIFYVIYIH